MFEMKILANFCGKIKERNIVEKGHGGSVSISFLQFSISVMKTMGQFEYPEYHRKI